MKNFIYKVLLEIIKYQNKELNKKEAHIKYLEGLLKK